MTSNLFIIFTYYFYSTDIFVCCVRARTVIVYVFVFGLGSLSVETYKNNVKIDHVLSHTLDLFLFTIIIAYGAFTREKKKLFAFERLK